MLLDPVSTPATERWETKERIESDKFDDERYVHDTFADTSTIDEMIEATHPFAEASLEG